MADILAARVFLAFDDFSLAGRHVLRFASTHGVQAQDVSRSAVATLFPDLSDCIAIKRTANIAFVTVKSSALTPDQRWQFADAFVNALDQCHVQELAVLAALHLPYAQDNVCQYTLNSDATSDNSEAGLPLADPKWDVKDPFLAPLLHLIKVERFPRTHLLLAKGYKPGRDLSGTYDAVDALARALQIFTKQQVTVDADEMQRQLPRLLAKEKVKTAENNEHLTLLYH